MSIGSLNLIFGKTRGSKGYYIAAGMCHLAAICFFVAG